MAPDRAPGRRRAWTAAALLLTALAAAGWWWLGRPDAAPQASAAPPPPAVTVSPPLRHELVEWDEYTGQFAAVEYVEIRARVSGYLDSIHFEDGQLVKQGDLLFVIDPRPYEIQLASAKAQLAEAQARLDLANRELSRAGQLRQKDFVSSSVFDQRNEEMRSAAAAVETAQAAIRQASLDVEFTHVTAPVSGRIGRHEVSVGNLVNGGSSGATTLLTTIVSLDPIHFYFDLSEQDYLAYQRAAQQGRLASTREGKLTVFAHLVDEQGWPHEGTLDFVDNQVDRSAGTIRARGIFPNPGLLITPGQFGRVRVPGSERYPAILVPEAALVTDQSRQLVMTVAADGTVTPRPVRVGPHYEGLRIIRSGLGPEDRVVINGLLRARPGARVTPQPGRIELDPQAE
ncbi:MAG: efflux RND transporter periplasmic adaptor subunit [Dongiaceae bacterium]